MKKILLFLSVLLLGSSGAWSQSTPVVVHRVNAGGPEVVDDVMNWSADTKRNPSSHLNPESPNYTSGAATWRGVNTTGAPDAIFGPNRYAPWYSWQNGNGSTMDWRFSVTPGLTYQVNLYFAESPYASGAHLPGQRLFDVYIEDKQVLYSYDIYATGGLHAIRERFSVVAEDDELNVSFWSVPGSIRSPQINGIEILTSEVEAPLALTGVAYADSIILNWQDASDDETGFEIFKAEYDGRTAYSYYTTVAPNTTTFKDINGKIGFDTWYKVRAVKGSSVSVFSNEFRRASEDAIPLPPDPIIPNVLSSSAISLTFYDNVAYAISFNVYRSESRGGPYMEIARQSNGDYEYLSGDTLVTVDSLLLPATTYYYYVESLNVAGLSSNSDTLALTTLPEVNAAGNREAIKVYPNPVENIVSVQIDNAQEHEVYIEIADKVGLPRYRSRTQLADGKAEVEIASLESGIYILHVTSSSGKESFRLVKR